jgi:hypothetical protein
VAIGLKSWCLQAREPETNTCVDIVYIHYGVILIDLTKSYGCIATIRERLSATSRLREDVPDLQSHIMSILNKLVVSNRPGKRTKKTSATGEIKRSKDMSN